jgi:hypothetical protein
MDIKAKKISLVDVKDIKLNPKNRNKHPAKQIDAIAKVLQYQGFRRPLTVSNQTGFLVCGEGRLLAAKKLGMDKVPVIFQDYDNPDQEFADSIADNALDKQSSLDFEGIKMDLTEVAEDFDLDMMGLDGLEQIFSAAEVLEEKEANKEPQEQKFIIEVQFPNDMEMNDIKDDLLSRGYIVKVK